jgi:hypothetical protein
MKLQYDMILKKKTVAYFKVVRTVAWIETGKLIKISNWKQGRGHKNREWKQTELTNYWGTIVSTSENLLD